MTDLLAIVFIAAVLALSVFAAIWRKKKGTACSGCSGCENCPGCQDRAPTEQP